MYDTISLRGASEVFYHSVVLSFSAVVSMESWKFKQKVLVMVNFLIKCIYIPLMTSEMYCKNNI